MSYLKNGVILPANWSHQSVLREYLTYCYRMLKQAKEVRPLEMSFHYTISGIIKISAAKETNYLFLTKYYISN